MVSNYQCTEEKQVSYRDFLVNFGVMAPPRVHMAINAMKAIGIPPQTVKPVLKRLLKAYGNNWTLIEDENYRVLADAIFDIDDSKVHS